MKSLDSHWFLIVAFVVLIGTLAIDFHFYYPDELHYTDAAIQMVKSGNYLTPLDGSMQARFNKPILSYWFVAAAYHLFGINAFSSRIFFLLAGAAVCLMIFYMGRLIYNKQDKAYLGLAIASTQITLIMSSIRSIPDILLCLFICLAFWGFLGFIKFGNDAPKRYHWMVFLGLSMAVSVKGIHALALGLAALAFLRFNPWQTIRFRKLLYWPSILLSVMAGCWWFAVMYIQHGQLFIDAFFHDQVGTRVSLNVLIMVKNLLLSLVYLTVLFIPWIFLTNPLRKLKNLNNTTFFDVFVLFIAATTVLLTIFVSYFYERYLLPAVPLLSIWLGHLIVENQKLSKRYLQFWVNLLIFFHAVILSFALLFQVTMPGHLHNYIFLATGIILTTLVAYQSKIRFHYRWFTILMLLLAFNLSHITRNIASPDEGKQIAAMFKQMEIEPGTAIAFAGERQVAAKIRVASKGRYEIVNLDDQKLITVIEEYDYVICNEKAEKKLPYNQYKKKIGSLSWNPHQGWTLFLSMLRGEYYKTLNSSGKKYFLIEKNERNQE